MDTKKLAATLTSHLEGFNFPRRVRQEVRKVFAHYLSKCPSVLDAYEHLSELREELARVADTSQLTIRQKRALLRSYCVLYGDQTTVERQIEKDLWAITGPEPSGALRTAMQYIDLAINQEFKDTIVSCSMDRIRPVHELVVDSRLAKSKAITPEAIANRIDKEIQRARTLGVGNPSVMAAVFPYVEPSLFLDMTPDHTALVGQVGWSQEPGMKLRLFASPYLFLQAALEPLKRGLQNLIRQIPEDHHGDQDWGRQFTQVMLQAGKTAHCYDLSNATHRFPFSVQVACLKKFRVPQWARDLYWYASKNPYAISLKEFDRIQWQAGQPLGTGPSFFTFSLCHHLLVRGIAWSLGLNPQGLYCLLGDDIVIFDKKLADRYQRVMNKLGCDINLSKSIVSSEVAEFAGSLITPREIVNVGKWRPVTAHNGLSINTIWDSADHFYTAPKAFLTRTMPEDIRLLISSDLGKRLQDRVDSLIKGTDPNYLLFQTLLVLEKMGHTVNHGESYRTSLLQRFCRWLILEMDARPQCFPRMGHYASPSNTLIQGLKVLLTAAVEDLAVPIWWPSLLRFSGEPMREYTQGALIRLLDRLCSRAFLREVRFRQSDIAFARNVNKSWNKWSAIPRDVRIDTLIERVDSGLVSYEAVSVAINGPDCGLMRDVLHWDDDEYLVAMAQCDPTFRHKLEGLGYPVHVDESSSES